MCSNLFFIIVLTNFDCSLKSLTCTDPNTKDKLFTHIFMLAIVLLVLTYKKVIGYSSVDLKKK